MARYTRHQLKEDKFAEAAEETVHWAVAHRQKLVVAGIVVAVAVVLAAGFYFYRQQREHRASLVLAKALRVYRAPLRPANAPVAPTYLTFASAAERAKAAQKEFQGLVDSYPRTRTAGIANFFLAASTAEAGDTAAAEKRFQEIAGGRDDLAGMAKYALAALYRGNDRDADAIKLYKELIDKPVASVPKVTVQLELAQIYEKTDPGEARRLYEQIRKDEPNSIAASLAATKLGADAR